MGSGAGMGGGIAALNTGTGIAPWAGTVGAAGKPGGAVAGSCTCTAAAGLGLTWAVAAAAGNPGGGGTCRPGAMIK